jgi:hypothetical protein
MPGMSPKRSFNKGSKKIGGSDVIIGDRMRPDADMTLSNSFDGDDNSVPTHKLSSFSGAGIKGA